MYKLRYQFSFTTCSISLFLFFDAWLYKNRIYAIHTFRLAIRWQTINKIFSHFLGIICLFIENKDCRAIYREPNTFTRATSKHFIYNRIELLKKNIFPCVLQNIWIWYEKSIKASNQKQFFKNFISRSMEIKDCQYKRTKRNWRSNEKRLPLTLKRIYSRVPYTDQCRNVSRMHVHARSCVVYLYVRVMCLCKQVAAPDSEERALGLFFLSLSSALVSSFSLLLTFPPHSSRERIETKILRSRSKEERKIWAPRRPVRASKSTRKYIASVGLRSIRSEREGEGGGARLVYVLRSNKERRLE